MVVVRVEVEGEMGVMVEEGERLGEGMVLHDNLKHRDSEICQPLAV